MKKEPNSSINESIEISNLNVSNVEKMKLVENRDKHKQNINISLVNHLKAKMSEA